MSTPNASSFYLYVPSNGGPNISFPNMDRIYDALGFSELNTQLYLYAFLPTSALGLLLNLMTLAVLWRIPEQVSIYFYWRVEILTGLVANTLGIFGSFYMSRRFLPFANEYGWAFYQLYIYSFLNVVTYFYRSLIDIVVVLDRIAVFVPRVKSVIFKLTPMTNSLILLAFATLMSIPQFFYYRMFYYKFYLIDRTSLSVLDMVEIFQISSSPYASQTAGRILNSILVFIRNILPLVLETSLNLISIQLFRKQMRKKRTIAGPFSVVNNPTQAGLPPSQESRKKSSSVTQRLSILLARPAANSDPEKNLFMMVLALSFMSIAQQMIASSNTIYVLAVSAPSLLFVFLFNYSTSVKHSINFFVFYFFNKNFKKKLHELFGF